MGTVQLWAATAPPRSIDIATVAYTCCMYVDQTLVGCVAHLTLQVAVKELKKGQKASITVKVSSKALLPVCLPSCSHSSNRV
eukprot:SAG22_NODE_101_length_20519_cov_15.588002_28_plen_82_part_00